MNIYLSEVILCIVIVETKQFVCLVLFLSISSVFYLFFLVFKMSARNMINLLQLCFRISIEHVWHPFSLNRFDWMVNSGAACTK